MNETEKAEIQSLSTQELYHTFNECLAEIINRGLNVYYSPSENAQDGQTHLNFPTKSCGNVRVFETMETGTDTTSTIDDNDQQYYQDGPRDDGQAEKDGLSLHNDQTNCVQNVPNDGNQYDYNAPNSEFFALDGYEDGQQDKFGDDLDASFHVSGDDINAQPFVPIMASASPGYITSPSTPEDSMSFFFRPIPEYPETMAPSLPLSEEEQWDHAVSFTTAVMNNFPHCKDFPQCFFNPDGPRSIPQTVEEVPTGAPIRELLHARKGLIRNIKFCSNLCSRLRTQQKHMVEKGFVVVRKASPPPKKLSPVRVAPSYDAVMQEDEKWWRKRKERRRM